MTKLSDLTAATVLDATDDMPINQDTGSTPVSKKSALSLIRDWTTSNATGLSVASGTITASAPVTITQTWNDGAVTFKGLDVNVTDTASAAASLLADFRVGGTSEFSVTKTGKVIAGLTSSNSPTYSFAGDETTGWGYRTASNLAAICSASEVMRLNTVNSYFFNNLTLLANTTYLAFGVSSDIRVYRDAAAQLALRDSTNAQSLAVYTTESSSLTNYERLRIYGTAGGAFTIASEAAGTGTVRQIKVSADLLLRPSASVTPPSNGDVAFELTSNTTLTIKVKGSDGTVRSVALTLA